MAAVRSAPIAGLVISHDIVCAVGAAAKGDSQLLMLGLAIGIPLVMFGCHPDVQTDGSPFDHRADWGGLYRAGQGRDHRQRREAEGRRGGQSRVALCLCGSRHGISDWSGNDAAKASNGMNHGARHRSLDASRFAKKRQCTLTWSLVGSDRVC